MWPVCYSCSIYLHYCSCLSINRMFYPVLIKVQITNYILRLKITQIANKENLLINLNDRSLTCGVKKIFSQSLLLRLSSNKENKKIYVVDFCTMIGQHVYLNKLYLCLKHFFKNCNFLVNGTITIDLIFQNKMKKQLQSK